MAKKRAAPRKKKGRVPPPVCKAILLCQELIIEARSHHVSLINIFDTFQVPKFPGSTPPFKLFMQLVNGVGAYDITVEVRDLLEDKIVARAQICKLAFVDREAKANVNLTVPAIPMSHPGVYEFVVFADEQEIDRQRFIASSPEGKDDASDQADQE